MLVMGGGGGVGGVGEGSKRGNVLLLSLGHVGEFSLESPQSDPSVTELRDNTNILFTWTHMQAGPQGGRHEKGNTGMRTSPFVFTSCYSFILHLYQMSVSTALFSGSFLAACLSLSPSLSRAADVLPPFLLGAVFEEVYPGNSGQRSLPV